MNNPNRVLIIDDEPEIRDFFRDVAEEAGFATAEAGDRDEFAAAYEQLEPGLVLLDLTMPDTDGVEFLRELAKRGCTAPIILASGKDERVLATAQRLGCMFGLKMQGVLQKPVSVSALEGALDEVKVAHADCASWRPTPERLGKAITEGEFSAYFQPKVDLQCDGYPIAGAEALVRWRHPVQGVIPPDHFLPIAEAADLIGPLTEAVLKFTISQLKTWTKAGAALPVAVNLSPKQLTDLTLPDRIAKLLADAGLDPSLLVVEVTEQAAMADIGAATDILTRLRLKEIAVSLDDFGAGYSSLIEVYRLPLNELKLDRSLITDIERDEGARTVIKAIIAMARELKLEICVEGVETIRTARFLQSLGCEKAQGYYFSKPLNAEDFTELLTKGSTTPTEGVPNIAAADRKKSFQARQFKENKSAKSQNDGQRKTKLS